MVIFLFGLLIVVLLFDNNNNNSCTSYNFSIFLFLFLFLYLFLYKVLLILKKKYNKFDSSILQLTLSDFQKLVTLFVSFYPRSSQSIFYSLTMYTTNTLLDEKLFLLLQKYLIYHQPFTNTYQSNRYIYIIDKYFCKFIHNPIISSIILILSYTYYYYYYYNNDNYDYDDYYLPQYLFVNDLVSNIINLICILRFQYRFKFNHLIGELIFSLVNQF